METALANQLVESINLDRLVFFCGAGLSMGAPSEVPSAIGLAQQCCENYQNSVGSALPAEFESDLEALVDYFLENGGFETTFLQLLVPWTVFRDKFNFGHLALADFLCCSVCSFAVTTNFDTLIERGAYDLGERNFRSAWDGEEMARSAGYPHRGYLKIHGCCERDPVNTLWSRKQLDGNTLTERIEGAKNWLRGNLMQKDIVLIGFWSDWAYLNEILSDCLSKADQPNRVILVNPQDATVLQEKAPQLWKWAQTNNLEHVKESGTEFLDQLRIHYSKVFLRRLCQQSDAAFRNDFGGTLEDFESSLETIATSDQLFRLRRDLCGQPSTLPVRQTWPSPQMTVTGAVLLWLIENGEVENGNIFLIGDFRIRVLGRPGESISAVRRQFAEEPLVAIDKVLCAGSLPDGNAAANIVREGSQSTVVRPQAGSAEWIPVLGVDSLQDLLNASSG